jgi:hypothetical protein
MKYSTTLALSGLLATTAQACTRVLVNEVWQSKTERTRDVTLWDNNKVNGLKMPFAGADELGDTYRANDYFALIYWNNERGVVSFPDKSIIGKPANLRLGIPQRTEIYLPFHLPTASRCCKYANLLLLSHCVGKYLIPQARRQSTLPNGQTQVYYCLWDNYDCGGYTCGLP